MDYYSLKSKLNTFSYDFIKWLKINFVRIESPCNDCLVVMTNQDGSLHVGIHNDGSITHNWSANNTSKGSVISTPLTVVKLRYSKVRFYKWSK